MVKLLATHHFGLTRLDGRSDKPNLISQLVVSSPSTYMFYPDRTFPSTLAANSQPLSFRCLKELSGVGSWRWLQKRRPQQLWENGVRKGEIEISTGEVQANKLNTMVLILCRYHIPWEEEPFHSKQICTTKLTLYTYGSPRFIRMVFH